MVEYLLPKQVVVGSNPITRSTPYNGGACLSKMSVKTLLGKYHLFAEAQGQLLFNAIERADTLEGKLG